MKIELCDCKYTYINDEKGQRALRHGLPWRNLIGDGFILAMAQRIEELEKQLEDVETELRVEMEHTAYAYENGE
jgi:hypothetical protein